MLCFSGSSQNFSWVGIIISISQRRKLRLRALKGTCPRLKLSPWHLSLASSLLVGGDVLCIVGHLEASLASVHKMPVALPFSMTTKNVSRRCQLSLHLVENYRPRHTVQEMLNHLTFSSIKSQMYFYFRAHNVKAGKKVRDYLNEFVHLQIRSPTTHRSTSALCQESGGIQINTDISTMHKLFLILLPHLFSRNIPSPCSLMMSVFYSLPANTQKANKWPGSFSLRATK